jgi:hypothetical protein
VRTEPSSGKRVLVPTCTLVVMVENSIVLRDTEQPRANVVSYLPARSEDGGMVIPDSMLWASVHARSGYQDELPSMQGSPGTLRRATADCKRA